MNYDERVKAVNEIINECDRRGDNFTTLVLLMASMTNKPFDRFYESYMNEGARSSRAEHPTHNRQVAGSNPAGPTENEVIK